MLENVPLQIRPAVKQCLQDCSRKIEELIHKRISCNINWEIKELHETWIREAVVAAFKIDWLEIKSSSRFQNVTTARYAYCYLVRSFLNYSYQSIGAILNGRDHTTIMKAVSVTQNLLDVDDQLMAPKLNGIIDQLTKKLNYEKKVQLQVETGNDGGANSNNRCGFIVTAYIG